MKSDARLVENSQNAHKLRPYLRCKPNTLCFSARKRPRRSIERKIPQPDIDHELDPLADFFDDLFCDFGLPRIQAQGLEELPRICKR